MDPTFFLFIIGRQGIKEASDTEILEVQSFATSEMILMSNFLMLIATAAALETARERESKFFDIPSRNSRVGERPSWSKKPQSVFRAFWGISYVY